MMLLDIMLDLSDLSVNVSAGLLTNQPIITNKFKPWMKAYQKIHSPTNLSLPPNKNKYIIKGQHPERK